jgi:hypothetical protein
MAFPTDWNFYEYTRVPFGIATGAQVLTRLLDKVFSGVKFKYVFHYLDDLVIYSDFLTSIFTTSVKSLPGCATPD